MLLKPRFNLLETSKGDLREREKERGEDSDPLVKIRGSGSVRGDVVGAHGAGRLAADAGGNCRGVAEGQADVTL